MPKRISFDSKAAGEWKPAPQLYQDRFPTGLQWDVFKMLCGDFITNGMSRDVFISAVDKSCVVKVETQIDYFQNVEEWETWKEVEDTEFAKWFAPCCRISQVGMLLIQKRTSRPAENQWPDRLPAFLTDTKKSNYGMFEGRLVCHDYGTNLLRTVGMTKRMRKVVWSP